LPFEKTIETQKLYIIICCERNHIKNKDYETEIEDNYEYLSHFKYIRIFGDFNKRINHLFNICINICLFDEQE